MTGSEGTGRVTSRRAVVAAAGAAGLTAALAACGGSGDGGEEAADEAGAPEAGADSGGDAGSGDAGGESGGTELAKTSDIPEGGGTVFPDQKVVVTQPTAGEFKAFSSVCTHQGCAVREVANGTINCPCHNSLFDASDGSVKGGPAKEPLPPANITVQGDSVMLS